MLGGVEESNLFRTQTGSAQSLRVAFPYSVRRPGSRPERRSKTVLINIIMRKTFGLMFSTFCHFFHVQKWCRLFLEGRWYHDQCPGLSNFILS